MKNFNLNKEELTNQGFSITKVIFSDKEILKLVDMIEYTEDNYAIRQLVNKVPEIQDVIFQNKEFKELYKSICGKDYFLSKAIFFNKPSKSNWFVGNHQDLSISVQNKKETKGYINWTNKDGQLGVIPPQEILEKIITIRIHLDKTDETNGALKVIPNSHKKGIIRIDKAFDKKHFGEEMICNVEKGSVMLMKPLLLHSSAKSTSDSGRRVIHLEFYNQEIPMNWLEKSVINYNN